MGEGKETEPGEGRRKKRKGRKMRRKREHVKYRGPEGIWVLLERWFSTMFCKISVVCRAFHRHGKKDVEEMHINLISKAVCTSTRELLGIHKPNS